MDRRDGGETLILHVGSFVISAVYWSVESPGTEASLSSMSGSDLGEAGSIEVLTFYHPGQ